MWDYAVSAYDFTKEMLLNDNDLVNRLCDCSGSTKTISRRVYSEVHEQSCPYYQVIMKRREEFLTQVNEARARDNRS